MSKKAKHIVHRTWNHPWGRFSLITILGVGLLLGVLAAVSPVSEMTADAISTTLKPVSPDATVSSDVEYFMGIGWGACDIATDDCWQYIDEDPNSPGSTYLTNMTGKDVAMAFNLTDMPSNFVSMASLTMTVHVSSTLFGDDSGILTARIYQSDITTPLTDAVTIGDETTVKGTYNFDMTNVVASNSSTWNGAVLQLFWDYSANMSNDNGEIRIHAIEFAAEYAGSNPVLDQTHYRWRYDDGSQTSATWMTTEDTSATIKEGVLRRLRFAVANTGGQATTSAFRIEYATATSGPWTAVGPATSTTTHWVYSNSANISDGESTSNVSGGVTDTGSFTSGHMKDAGNTTANISLSAGYFTEVEYAITPTSTAVDGGTYYFRLTNNGTPLDTYSQYATAIADGVAQPASIEQLHYIFNNDIEWNYTDMIGYDLYKSFADIAATSSLIYVVGGGSPIGSGAADDILFATTTASNGVGTPILTGSGASLDIIHPQAYIAYFNNGLQFAESADIGQTWVSSTVDAGVSGLRTDIAVADTNSLFIAYDDSVNGGVKIARTSNGGGAWVTSTVHAFDTVGLSMAAADANNLFVLSNGSTSEGLIFANSVDGGASWSTSTIEGGDIIMSDIKISDSNTLHVGYFDMNTQNVVYARSTDGGSSWSTSTVSSLLTGSYGTTAEILSIAPVDNEIVNISYYDSGKIWRSVSRDSGASWSLPAPIGDMDLIVNISAVYGAVSALVVPGTDWYAVSYIYDGASDAQHVATIIAASKPLYLTRQDTPATGVKKLDRMRVRFGVANTGDLSKTLRLRMQYATSTEGPWTYVGGYGSTATDILIASSTWDFNGSSEQDKYSGDDSYVTNEASIFSNSKFEDYYSYTQTSFEFSGDTWMEFVFNITATSTAQNGETYYLRLISMDEVLPIDNYGVYPTFTLEGPELTQSHYRWRNDNGGEQTQAAQPFTAYLMPDGAGSYTSWTDCTNESCSGTGLYTSIDDARTSPDDASTGISTATENAQSSFTFEDPSGSATGTITGITVHMRGKQNADDGILPRLIINSTLYDGASNFAPPNGSYGNGSVTWSTNPATAAAWQWSDLTNLEVAFQGVKNGNPWSSTVLYMTQAYIEVNYTKDVTAATWAASEDASITDLPIGTTRRVRFQVANNTSLISGTTPYRLEYSTSTSGNWTQVQTSGTDWILADSTYFTDGDSTANISGVSDAATTFVAGALHDTTSETSGIVLDADEFTEIEFAITPDNSVSVGDVYYFRLSNGGDDLQSYTIYASATAAAVGGGSPDLRQIHYRWRDDLLWEDHSDGGWSAVSLDGVSAVSASDIWVAGAGGHVWHYNGSGWAQHDGTGKWGFYALSSVSALSSSSVWVVGQNGHVWHYNGSGWAQHDGTGKWATNWLKAASALSASDVWIAGASGHVWHYNGSGWTQHDGTDRWGTNQISSISALSASDVWIAGASGHVWHYNGSGWTQHDGTGKWGTTSLSSISAASVSDVWIAGASGHVWHYNGSGWTQHDGTGKWGANSVSAIYAVSAADVWLGGGAGNLWHYNGSGWTQHDGTDRWGTNQISSISALSASDVWMAGASGQVWHYNSDGFWLAAEDVGITNVQKGSTTRLRFEVANTGTASSAAAQYRIEYQENGTSSSWIVVGAGGDWQMSASAYITDGASTTNLLTAAEPTFRAGQYKDTGNQADAIILEADEFTEYEFAIVASTSATDSGTYYFRLSNAGSGLDGYAVYASATLAGLIPSSTITVSATGTQTATGSIPDTDFYLGGAFTFVRDSGTTTITSIELSETGSINAQTNLSNVRVYYETAATCSYGGGETFFGSSTFDGSANAAITGSMEVGTSQVCAYVVLDIGSGATSTDEIDIEISDPTTEVLVTSGSVAGGTAAIGGVTGFDAPVPNIRQIHWRWRNDDGAL